MSDKGIRPIVSEYHILWEALQFYAERLEKLSSMSTDDDQRLRFDEKLQDLDGILRSIQSAAKRDYNVDLK
jgi:hypothetical protein